MNPIQGKRAASAGRATALGSMQMPPPGQPAAGQLPQDDESDAPKNAQDDLFKGTQGEFAARPSTLKKIRARGPTPGSK